MANKKLIYNSEDGRIREISSGSGNSSTYYDDTLNKLYAKNITFNTMSVDAVHGLPLVYNQTMSIISVSDGDILSWDNSNNAWKTVTASFIDITANTASANADVSGTFSNIKVKSLSNVRSGSALSVGNGGTGLSLSDYSSLSGEAILVGNGTSKFTFLTASSDTSSTNNISTDGTKWVYLTTAALTSSIDVQVFTSSATWTKPSGTKFIRVLVQGAGGGGGSGANRAAASAFRSGGGGGGSSGGFIDKTYTVGFNDTNFIVTVGTGGAGGTTPATGNNGNVGLAGGSSSFGTSSLNLFVANGGLGGAAGIYNSAATSAGGTAVTGAYNVWEAVLYGPLNVGATSIAGGSGSATAGQSVSFTSSSTSYYISAGGGGGGSVSGATIYAGGNGGTSNFNSGSTTLSKDAGSAVSASVTGALGLVSSNFANNSQFNNIFIACGGGGGAGSNSAIGGLGGSGSWGSGGGGGGGSENAASGVTQGGRGGDGYVVVISYK